VGFFDHLMRDIRSIVDRDGEQNAQPEPVTEHRDAVARVLVVAALVRTGAPLVLVHRD